MPYGVFINTVESSAQCSLAINPLSTPILIRTLARELTYNDSRPITQRRGDMERKWSEGGQIAI